MSAEIIRYSWEKNSHPFIRFLSSLHTPRIKTIRTIKLPRLDARHTACTIPASHPNPFVEGTLYYAGTAAELSKQKRLLFHVPGGGFVTMTPRHHEDYLCILTKRLNVPILSINYKKAPEYPYPCALHEVFDVYACIYLSRGRCIGMNEGEPGSEPDDLTIAMMGDSAGGNLTTSTILKLLQETNYLRPPNALVLIYPFRNFDVQGWIHQDYRGIVAANGKYIEKSRCPNFRCHY